MPFHDGNVDYTFSAIVDSSGVISIRHYNFPYEIVSIVVIRQDLPNSMALDYAYLRDFSLL